MADRGKFKQKHDWRIKETNQSSCKYLVKDILKLFNPNSIANFSAPEEIYSNECLMPILNDKLVSGCINSRKNISNKEPIPEWYTEDAFVITGNNINVEEIEEKYSQVDVKYEASIKITAEEDEKLPDWDDPCEEESTSISYPVSLVTEHANEGNPFACIIMAHSIHFDGQIIPDPSSIPFEKVWYYKDPQNTVQGPFSTIEMFNWSAAGFFNSKLQVAHSSPLHFFALQMYILQEKCKQIPNYAKDAQ